MLHKSIKIQDTRHFLLDTLKITSTMNGFESSFTVSTAYLTVYKYFSTHL